MSVQTIVQTMSVSIHAFREEGDVHVSERGALHLRVSIHAFREEGD